MSFFLFDDPFNDRALGVPEDVEFYCVIFTEFYSYLSIHEYKVLVPHEMYRPVQESPKLSVLCFVAGIFVDS